MESMPKIMAGIIFGLGVITVILGLVIIMAKEYHETLRVLSTHSTKLSGRAITEEGMGPVLDGMSRLMDAIRRLIATAVGVGAFLCLIGVGMFVLGYWMFVSR
ncbi:MAG: hypothetical protein HY677_02095 [Chloroflexi bacterium]|nr:hypothetical protein [Chloroflexota bacterium]